jgi:hypothetical protein
MLTTTKVPYGEADMRQIGKRRIELDAVNFKHSSYSQLR